MFRVEWSQAALLQVTNAWLDASSSVRAAITASTNQIDAYLCDDPATKGESRSEGLRILLVSPLGVVFQVDPQRKAAVILRAWAIPKKS